MKTFEAPKMEIIRFGSLSIFTASCEPCPGCPPGSYGCPCVDSWSSDYNNQDGIIEPEEPVSF